MPIHICDSTFIGRAGNVVGDIAHQFKKLSDSDFRTLHIIILGQSNEM